MAAMRLCEETAVGAVGNGRRIPYRPSGCYITMVMNIIVIIIIIIIIIVTVIIITDAAGNDRSKNRLTTATVVMFSLTTTKTSAFNEKSHFSLPITITDENYNEN